MSTIEGKLALITGGSELSDHEIEQTFAINHEDVDGGLGLEPAIVFEDSGDLVATGE